MCRDLAQVDISPEGVELIKIGKWWHVTHNGDVDGSGVYLDLSEEEQLVRLADDLQTLVSNNAGDPVWPVCTQHDFGLHPQLKDGRAIWMCRPHASCGGTNRLVDNVRGLAAEQPRHLPARQQARSFLGCQAAVWAVCWWRVVGARSVVMARWTWRAMCRFKQRMIIFLVLPWASRLAM